MIPTITTTHAIPQSLPPAGLKAKPIKSCSYCFEPLGLASSLRERASLELKHICKEKLQAHQPAVGVPFN
ncbi:hypothetical protein [Acidipila rosea]|uniref:Uncharacterized protein n=1 Tax=Acidipila rosea TaxID=768535 RepID=A0A4V2PVH7_9BACT|nr:hypothetical protein [Acidipila rosea]MBW4026880.1 hypothetical protein [Acidobacteriota bacterium]MBW4043459.1 hypothetical protein [Acidobacteriota bacterium]TCK73761.1 hypothetical protein C7378_1375 [Acidipila rosea]